MQSEREKDELIKKLTLYKIKVKSIKHPKLTMPFRPHVHFYEFEYDVAARQGTLTLEHSWGCQRGYRFIIKK